MMENPRPEEENTIIDIRNFFRLEKEIKSIKDRILRDIKNSFELEEEKTYYKPVRVSNFWSNNYIWYENNGDGNKTLSVEEYLKDTINPYYCLLKNAKFSIKKSND